MFRLTGMLLLSALLGQMSAFGQTDDVELERIIVTPYRYDEEIGKVAANITVITNGDIKDSNSKNILDVLKTVAGLVVRDYYGTGVKASVDLRGFGEQGGMNVLVLVDGRRVNEIDLSGVDWAQIPLEQVEKIEVVRGWGSVLYGDNATSGVINIITKKGKGKPQLNLEAQVGSYDLEMQKLSVSGSKGAFSYYFSGGHEATNGYRKNSYYKTGDFGTKLSYGINQDLTLRFSQGFHKAEYGLPGPLSSKDLETMSRRSSKYGDDHANDRDYYFLVGADKDSEKFGKFDADVSFRRREVDTFWLTSSGGWNPTYKSRIDTIGITPKYLLDKNIFGQENKLIAGFDFYRSDYMSDNYNNADVLQNTTDINKISTGYYIQDEFSIFKNLTILGGFRYEAVKYEFDYRDNSGWNPDIDRNIRPNKKAYNGGLLYNYKDDSSVFFNINQGFRFPAADEYLTWGALNTDLAPQTSRNYELGIRHRFNQNLKCDFSVYSMNIKNELYYNPAGGPFGWGANENYDKTRHQGIEFAFDSKIMNNIGFFGNYSYSKAVFKTGAYDAKDIPMVPRHKGSVGLKFLFPKNITLNISGNYVGKRYFINDQANVFSQLNGYMTADMNVSYTYKDLRITAGINNIFDKKYSEFGVCNSATGAKNYYPSPERNFNLKLEYKF